ncbi:MAG TPA: urea ABC transporter permease subunit UrtB, partial [Planctomycetaceae bacterium]|nr:urea ABC transporter permease subunit UrtB [Planctomycetaceae bacterium]
MRFASLRRTALASASLIFFAVLIPSPACAQDDAIRQQIAKLADRDVDARQEAIEALGQTRDERVARVLQALQQGNLVVWNKRVLVRQDVQKGPGGKNVVPLLDPLTMEPALDAAKKPLLVDADEPRELQPTRQERRLLSGVIKFLQDFGSADPEKRLLAVRRLGDNPDATYLPALEQVAESDVDARVRRAARESAALTRIGADIPDQKPADRLAAVSTLSSLHSVQGLRVLQQMVQQGQVTGDEKIACENAIRSILRYQFWVGLGVNLTNGLSAGSVLILMALGLSIIYGQMGVINMAHGEFMILGAYMTYFCSHLFQDYLPGAYGGYFFVAIVVAFIVSGTAGLLVEWALIRHLYARPLDTLLATWGLSLIMQQAFRSGFGAREVGVELPPWMMGSLQVTSTIEVQINGLFVMALTLLITATVALLLYRSRWGLQVRAVMANRAMSGAAGIDTRRVDRLTFGLGCGIAGIAGSAFTMIGSTGPTAGQLYIVDTYLVVVFGGAQSLP